MLLFINLKIYNTYNYFARRPFSRYVSRIYLPFKIHLSSMQLCDVAEKKKEANSPCR